MGWVLENWVSITTITFAVIGVASLIAKMTPTEKDDIVIDVILGLLNKIALNPNKDSARK